MGSLGSIAQLFAIFISIFIIFYILWRLIWFKHYGGKTLKQPPIT